jgi:hypothetical protein
VWNKQPEHFRIVTGTFYYDSPSFVDYEDVKKHAYDNRKNKATKVGKWSGIRKQ